MHEYRFETIVRADEQPPPHLPNTPQNIASQLVHTTVGSLQFRKNARVWSGYKTGGILIIQNVHRVHENSYLRSFLPERTFVFSLVRQRISRPRWQESTSRPARSGLRDNNSDVENPLFSPWPCHNKGCRPNISLDREIGQWVPLSVPRTSFAPWKIALPIYYVQWRKYGARGGDIWRRHTHANALIYSLKSFLVFYEPDIRFL